MSAPNTVRRFDHSPEQKKVAEELIAELTKQQL